MRAIRLGKFHRSEEGQTLVLFGASLMMVLMFAGMGIDVGYLRYQKQQMQKAADSAALAGAEALNVGDGNDYAVTAAQGDAMVNGFPNGTNGISVEVNIPPVQSPNFSGKAGYVEVVVKQARPTFFMKIAGWGQVDVASRAVAGTTAAGSGCIYALAHGNQDGTLRLNGTVNVIASCGVYVNSTSPQALRVDGSGNVNAGTAGAGIGVVGPGDGTGWSPGGGPYCAGRGFCPQPVNIPVFTDPLQHMAAPPTPTHCDYTTPQGGNTGSPHLVPGVYCAGIDIGGTANATFDHGLYTVCNGMSVHGNATVQGSGVTFFSTGKVPGVGACSANYAPVTITGRSGSYLTAPTSGSGCSKETGCPGILFFQDRQYVSPDPVDASSFDGTDNVSYTGVLYFPGTKLTYAGNPHHDVASLIIAWQLTFNGNTTVNNQLLEGGGSPLTSAALVE